MGRSPSTFAKRQKEIAQQERVRERAERRDARREQRSSKAPGVPGVDPDIAGIVAGPQPVPDED